MTIKDLGTEYVTATDENARPHYWVTFYDDGQPTCAFFAYDEAERDLKIREHRMFGEEVRFVWVVPN